MNTICNRYCSTSYKSFVTPAVRRRILVVSIWFETRWSNSTGSLVILITDLLSVGDQNDEHLSSSPVTVRGDVATTKGVWGGGQAQNDEATTKGGGRGGGVQNPRKVNYVVLGRSLTKPCKI